MDVSYKGAHYLLMARYAVTKEPKVKIPNVMATCFFPLDMLPYNPASTTGLHQSISIFIF
jgi:hypothetical protein